MADEFLTAGEFSRWAECDREWKADLNKTMTAHAERLAALEVLRTRAETAETSATSARRWASAGAIVQTLVNAIVLAFTGGSPGK